MYCYTKENGDWNWIIPNKFIAFSGPHDKARAMQGGLYTLSAVDYARLFKRLGVSGVIRLNTPVYDRHAFLNEGIQHYDLFFKDGTVPSAHLLSKFFQIVEGDKPFAIHCKAGLGRTGSLIGAYIMKYHGFSPKEAIAWMRIVRPGSVIGPQQHWLEQIHPKMRRLGDRYRNGINVSEKSRVERNDQTGFPRVYTGRSDAMSSTRAHSSSQRSRKAFNRDFVQIVSTPTTEQASTQKTAGSPTISEHNRKTVTANHAHARFGQNSYARRLTPNYSNNGFHMRASTSTPNHFGNSRGSSYGLPSPTTTKLTDRSTDPRHGNPQSHLRMGKERPSRLSQTTALSTLQGHGMAPTEGSEISALSQSMPKLGNRSPQTR